MELSADQPHGVTLGRVSEHLGAFNEAVMSGEFAGFADRFSEDAVMSFVGVPAGPFHGRDAIRAGYRAMPPDDTMVAISADTLGDTDMVRFRWSRGGSGTMILHWAGDLVAGLEVAFDSEDDDGDH